MDELLGTWRIESVGGRGTEGGPVLEFTADGAYSGRSGLNRLRGAYEAGDGVLRCTEPVTTKMAGPPDLLDQEARLLAALGEPAAVARDGARLVLGSGEHEIVLAPAG